MIKVIDKIKKVSIATMILAVISGVAFIANPALCQKYISILIGVAFISVGLVGVAVSMFGNKSYSLMALGIIAVVIGVVICFKYKDLTAVFIFVLGIFMIVAGFTDFFTSLKVLAASRFIAITSMTLAVLTIIFGFIAVFNAYETQEALIRLLGVALLVYAVMDLVAFFEVKALVRKVKQAMDEADNGNKEIETTGEIVED